MKLKEKKVKVCGSVEMYPPSACTDSFTFIGADLSGHHTLTESIIL